MNQYLTRVAAAFAAIVIIFATAPSASAHVTTVQTTAPAGGYATIELQVPHGCEGQSTNVVAVQLRDDISSVTAQSIPGWAVSYEEAPLDEPIELHGEAVTTYVSAVTWTATGDPLPDDQYLRFGISMKMPELVGERIQLPTVQTCVDGSESAWLDPDPEAEHPAPAVALVAADEEPVADEQESTASASADAETEPAVDTLARVLAAVAILVGAVGVVIGLRRRTS